MTLSRVESSLDCRVKIYFVKKIYLEYAMFYLLMRLLGFWGIIDAIWLAINPQTWNRFWQNRLLQMTNRGFLSRAIAVGELLASIWLIRKTR